MSKKSDIKECIQCLYTSRHPFGLSFDETGLCTGCITHREKTEWDWSARFEMLREKVRSTRRQSPYYDCVIPVRGTPEYFYVVDVVKKRLGLNPLVVSYNSQFNSEVAIRNLDRLRDVFDVDILVYTSNPTIYKKLVRESMVRLNNMRWPFIAGETSFPVYEAVERDIPLVIWPYHQPTEQVGMHSYVETPEMSRRGRAEFDLMGVEPSEFLAAETTITASDIFDIQYPTNYLLHRHNIVGIYLSNYLPWDTRRYSEEMIQRHGALGAQNCRTFDTYDRIDDMTYMSVHDIFKYALHGYSRVTDNLCREVRFGRISKSDARAIEQFYQQQYPANEIRIFLDWLGMNEKALQWYLERMPNHIDTRDTKLVLSETQRAFVKSFVANGPDVFKNDQYIIYGKGIDLDDTVVPGDGKSSTW